MLTFFTYLHAVVGLFQQSLVEYKTVTLWNKEYVQVEFTDMSLFDKENGEDVNSKRYGGLSYVMLKANNPPIKPPTISLNQLKIGFDLINHTDNTYLVDQIIIQPVRQIPLGSLVQNTGKWVGIPETNGFMGTASIKLHSLTEKTIYAPDKLTLDREGALMDSRILISVKPKEGLDEEIILAFKVKIHLIPLSLKDEELTIPSDKIYYMAINE